jgi:hypothetical protein
VANLADSLSAIVDRTSTSIQVDSDVVELVNGSMKRQELKS